MRPSVDWKHPIARGLLGCWLPGLQSVFDVSDRVAPLTFINTQNSTKGNTVDGPGHRAANAKQGYHGPMPAPWKSFKQGNSIFWRGSFDNPGSIEPNFQILFGCVYSVPEASPYGVFGWGSDGNFPTHYA